MNADNTAAASFRSFNAMWRYRVSATPDSTAVLAYRGGHWEPVSWRHADGRARRIAAGLLSLGVEPGQRVAIYAPTCPDWFFADVGIMMAGCTTVTIYPSAPTDDCRDMLRDSGSAAVFCADLEAVEQLRALRERLPGVQRVIAFRGRSWEGDWVMSLEELEQEGEGYLEDHPETLDAVHDAIEPSSDATVMYTSGTTGSPQGVVIPHDAWVYVGEAIDRLGLISPSDTQFLFLPLAHSFAKAMEAISVRLGVTTALYPPDDSLLERIAEVRPTYMAVVPRFLERIVDATRNASRAMGSTRDKGLQWAIDVGRRHAEVRHRAGLVGPILRAQKATADRLVLARIRRRFGGRLRFLICGGAPLSDDVTLFFRAVGIDVLEGYGLTESAAATCVNTPAEWHIGSVGKPLPGTQVRTSRGEVQLRSRGTATRYLDDPQGTEAMYTEDGWLRTGDTGEVLPSGHLVITGRIKDIIVTSGAKNVAPARFQQMLAARCPYVAQVMVHGDRRPYCVALITLDEEAMRTWSRNRKGEATVAELANDPAVHALIEKDVEQVNRQLASFETVRRFAIIGEPFTVENGLLTPTLKVRRRQVEERYQHRLDSLYAGSSAQPTTGR